jgi:glycosyltransferase involved in cell wall biosynthesis
MTPVFFLLSDPDPCGEAARLARLLPPDRFRATAGVLGPADDLRAAGVPAVPVPLRHPLDLGGARRLRRAVAESGAAVVHAWGPAAVRAARLVPGPRLVVSGAASPGGGLGGWVTARALGRADRVVAETWADGERYRRLGVRAERLTRIAPAAPDPGPDPDPAGVFKPPGVPPGARLLVAGGRAERGVGPRDALVAFDMLRLGTPDLHLAVFGAGADAPALDRFARALAFDDFRVRFAPPGADRAAAVRAASAVLVTVPRGGAGEALEAMAAGVPVVGWATPDLVEVVDDGVTGFLVPAGDRAALAAKARGLLADPAAAARMGAAGRARAADRFPAARAAEQFARLYAELAAG